METHTPEQRLRQLVPSLFLSGQVTSWAWSETEKELVKPDFGGMAACCMYPRWVGSDRVWSTGRARTKRQLYWIVARTGRASDVGDQLLCYRNMKAILGEQCKLDCGCESAW